MPLRYSTPGAYVETFDADPQRIRRRRTDVVGFAGIAPRGPIGAAVKIRTWRQFESTFGGTTEDAYLGYAVYGFFLNGGDTCWVARAGDPSNATTASVCLTVENLDPVRLEAMSPGAWGNSIVITPVWERDRIVELIARNAAGDQQRLPFSDLTLPGHRSVGALDSGPAARVQTNLLGVRDEALAELNAEALVRVVEPTDGERATRLDATRPEARLTGGADGAGAIRIEHLIGSDAFNAPPMGLKVLERVDGVSLVAIPDLMIGQDVTLGVPRNGPFKDVAAAHEAVMASCLRCGDRMAILDMPPYRPRQAEEYPAQLQASSIAALYYPWVFVEDPLRVRGPVRRIPPSGHVAGMFARVDRKRGVHKPPANEPLEGALDVTEMIDEATHGTLNTAGVNAIRAVAGRGILVFGARTLDRDVKWRYVNIRRLFLMIEETLDEELQSLVFEPNDPSLWREIRRSVGGFLERLWRQGMLDGATADVAYTVRCDASTNPPWETEQGRVTCLVGLQPPYPAEFVIVRIGVTRDGVEVRSDEVRNA